MCVLKYSGRHTDPSYREAALLKKPGKKEGVCVLKYSGRRTDPSYREAAILCGYRKATLLKNLERKKVCVC